jgi:hypothetical protein
MGPSLRQYCPLLAPNGHAEAGRRRLLLRVKRTCRANPGTSEFDPKRTSPRFYSLSQITPRLLRT